MLAAPSNTVTLFPKATQNACGAPSHVPGSVQHAHGLPGNCFCRALPAYVVLSLLSQFLLDVYRPQLRTAYILPAALGPLVLNHYSHRLQLSGLQWI